MEGIDNTTERAIELRDVIRRVICSVKISEDTLSESYVELLLSERDKAELEEDYVYCGHIQRRLDQHKIVNHGT